MSSQVLKVAICLYPGVQLLDFSGPLDLLGFLSASTPVFTTPPPPYLFALTQLSTEDTVAASCGLAIKPGSTYAQELAAGTQYDVLLILQQAGLLKGKRATTNKSLFNIITADSKDEVQWVHKARWVEDGNVWTASGVAAGMDMTIAFITHLSGPTVAAYVTSGAEYSACEKDNDPFAEIWSDEAQRKIAESFATALGAL
ncbi:class I glutamine amidotransferase-like protein [Auricularia subglabra TFB-10046 SS5]|uniref:Class I glutamine amidotransferase-like protein n=1 Tax=Auricularia subglabra (strain TFB-10046 / SS5) TaxID=717982 RepID=J0LE77_AURST|nr:class I glutamine amidotransferase-like protein [Auricularia subglabra TFB-10046 SS5]